MNETPSSIAKMVLLVSIVTVAAVVLVQGGAILVTGKTLRGAGVAIGVPVGLMVAWMMRGSFRRASQRGSGDESSRRRGG
jgi:hypothetical protein